MTDEQWYWLFVNQSIDNDEQLEGMCPDCQREVTSKRCSRCGKPLGAKSIPKFTNPNFDAERFEQLSNGTQVEADKNDENNDDIDYELIDSIINNDKGVKVNG